MANKSGDGATYGATSPATTTPDTDKVTDKTKAVAKAGDTEIKFFDGTVVKVNQDGDTVMSDHLLPGERLRREVDAEKAETKAADTKKSTEDTK